jgi:hypothetical protein
MVDKWRKGEAPRKTEIPERNINEEKRENGADTVIALQATQKTTQRLHTT